MVGDTWSVLILRDAVGGATQFDQFRSNLGIAPSILSRRLRAMTEAGVLEKRRYSDRPPRDEYVLTECGRGFIPILSAMRDWGIRFNAESVARSEDAGAGVTVSGDEERTPQTAERERTAPDAPAQSNASPVRQRATSWL
jgi:DNA-binding HxlR family transcriptional regulator